MRRFFLLLLRSENTEEENKYYKDAICRYGGEVITVKDTDSKDVFLTALEKVEGILLPGGCDVGRWDYFLINYAVCNNLKLLGICQGMQSMALWKSNDSLISIGNDFHHQKEGYVHSVTLQDSRLQQIVGSHSLRVNSHHYQTVKKSYLFTVVGRSSDGLIEAVENSMQTFQIGVQWHPERMLDYDDDSKKLISSFILL